MKISYKCDYALKIVLDLADFYPHQWVPRRHIADRQDIPSKFLEQILRQLIDGGFVRSLRGNKGGYQLARPPKEITVGAVVRLIEGPVYPISCVDPGAPPTCKLVAECAFCGIWREVGDSVARIVDGIDFEQLQRETIGLRAANGVLDYAI